MQEPELILGNRRGEVIRNDDPKQAGRVKVKVFGVHDGYTEDTIPWAIYTDPFMGGLGNIGAAIIPNVGAHVWTFFEGGDPNQPVYWAGAPAMSNGDTPDLPEESRGEESEYPNNKVFRTKAGFIIEIDDSEDATRLRIKQPSGNEKVTDHEGNVTEDIVGDVVETIAGKLHIDVEGEVVFRAPTMQFGEDDAVEQSVLGKKLEDWINNELIPWINAHTHTGNLGIPTSPPIAAFSAGTAAPAGAVWSKVNTNQ